MSEEQNKPGPWWETTPEGRALPLGLIKLDRKGSTAEWKELPDAEVMKRAAQFSSGVEETARAFDAAPLNWQGDGVMIFVTDEGGLPAHVRSVQLARLLWQRIRVDLNLPVRLGVHAAEVSWNPDTGKIRHQALDLCGHLEEAAPVNAIAISEDVFLGLEDADAREFAPLGVTRRDGTPAYVYPPAAAIRREAEFFDAIPDLETWSAFRRYLRSSEVSHLRYVGLRRAKKEPPHLDIRNVFVPQEVEWQSRQVPTPPAFEKALSKRGKADAMRGLDEASWMWGEGRATALMNIPELFRRHRSVMVLGHPGSGKTTLLRWLAVIAGGGPLAMARVLGVSERLLPLPVSVGRLAEIRREGKKTVSVIEAMAAYFCERNVGDRRALEEFLTRRLEAGDCLVLLDGLDEVRAEEREGIRDWLATFVANAGKNRIVVTSRRVGYTPIHLPGGAEVIVRPFGDAQVERYVRAFHRAYRRWESGADDAPAADREANAMLDKLRHVPQLQALARNPFLLSTLALIHRAEGQLPRHRVTAYMVFARALCETWSAARRIVPAESGASIPFEEEAIPILGELALRMHESYPRGIAPRKFVIDTLAEALARRKALPKKKAIPVAEEFLRRAGDEAPVLVERGPGEWGFLHLTFQEFFAAAGLHASEQFERVAFEHLFEKRWEEVIRLGVGYMTLIQNRPVVAGKFVEKVLHIRAKGKRAWITKLLQRQAPLAALLVSEAGGAVPDRLLKAIVGELMEWATRFLDRVELSLPLCLPVLEQLAGTLVGEELASAFRKELHARSEHVRDRACDALGYLRDEQAVDDLVGVLQGGGFGLHLSAALALGRIGSEEALDPLLDAMVEGDHEAAIALGRMRSPAAVTKLISALSKCKKDRIVGPAAAFALGDLEDASALGTLEDAFLEGEPLTSAAAAQAISRINRAEGVQLLRDTLSGNDSRRWVQAAHALESLSEAVAPEALHQAASGGPSEVRAQAIEALGILRCQDASDKFRQALGDCDRGVRLAGAIALARLGSPEAAEVLVRFIGWMSVTETFDAIQALSSLGTPGVVALVARLLDDARQVTRATAAQVLARIASAATVKPLMHALGDKDQFVRSVAATGLGRCQAWCAVPRLVRLLRGLRRASPLHARLLVALWRISEAAGGDAPKVPRRQERSGRRSASAMRPRPTTAKGRVKSPTAKASGARRTRRPKP